MSIRIFRDGNWERIKTGNISRRDIMHLDKEKDKELIRYLILHAPSDCRMSILDHAKEKYDIGTMPEPLINIDDPGDTRYEGYFVLKEQVTREDDRDVLMDAALYGGDHDMAAFAFCRLTGYSFPPDECDACSYRTFSCGTLPGLTENNIMEFCRTMIREDGQFRDVAEECLRNKSAMTGDNVMDVDRLRKALQEKPLDETKITALLEECTDDAVLYEVACLAGKYPEMISIRKKAASLIRNRDYQYALASHADNPSRTPMILNLYDTVEGDKLFIARTILTDPSDINKDHMLLFCEDENLLMLGWLHVYGARRSCAERLHALGSDYPEAYLEADPGKKAELEKEWIDAAAETALDILAEDNEVRERTAGTASVDSDPLRLYLAIRHPRKAVRWWHARKLSNPVYIAYAGSWTEDDQIKEELSVRIGSTALITDMLYGDLSGADLVFGFRKPEDLTLQDRFCVKIMKNHPDRTIREHVRTELLRGKVGIPGVDLTIPDPLYRER